VLATVPDAHMFHLMSMPELQSFAALAGWRSSG
jgi:hypothetical protein